jgi:adhesin HecA-like repeat protein
VKRGSNWRDDQPAVFNVNTYPTIGLNSGLLRLPDNARYRTQSDSAAHNLIEIERPNAKFKTWIWNDSMIIDAQAVSNTGRIYGDSISVNADALDNDVNAAGTAGVIASRGDIDLGVGTLTNREGAYILANDDLRIAATQVTNDSATIEAGGNLAIDAGRIDILNWHFATTTTTTDTSPQYFYTTPGPDVMLPGADTWF